MHEEAGDEQNTEADNDETATVEPHTSDFPSSEAHVAPHAPEEEVDQPQPLENAEPNTEEFAEAENAPPHENVDKFTEISNSVEDHDAAGLQRGE